MNKQIIKISNDEKRILLDTLDYDVDGEGYIINKQDRRRISCPFTKTNIKFEDASIMPGSTLVINTSPVTLSEYFYQYPDDE